MTLYTSKLVKHCISIKKFYISNKITRIFFSNPKLVFRLYATEKLNVNALLTKYARASTQDGVRVFSAKHMK